MVIEDDHETTLVESSFQRLSWMRSYLSIGGETMATNPQWRIYERIVAAFKAEDIGMDTTIASNVHLMGRHSQVPRQVDVLIEARWSDGTKRRILVDAKRRRRKLDVNDVGTFLSVLDDCSAERGILYSPVGWTPAAERLARDIIRITLLNEETLDEDEWPRFEHCGFAAEGESEPCRGVLLWNGQQLDSLDGMLWAIYYTGTCDVCHRFHVWCWDCGDQFTIPIDNEYTCSCGRLWACITRDEPLPETTVADRYGYLVVTANGQDIHLIDRAPLL
ncbi:MAG TPA: restriction endonuclease [Ktedonobacterales bacterium]